MFYSFSIDHLTPPILLPQKNYGKRTNLPQEGTIEDKQFVVVLELRCCCPALLCYVGGVIRYDVLSAAVLKK
ncbi:hypothetical protein SOVF_216300 [Spinacia oleracea]|nr:hypothetical protein SOVF_216300 [Spinacia oleracea]